MHNGRIKAAAAIAAATALAAAGLPSARAATDTWQGGTATTPTWDQPGNWSLNAKPGTADDAVFPTPVPGTPGATIGLGAAETANSLSFNAAYTLGTAAGAGDLTLTTNAVSVGGGITAAIAAQLKGSAGLAVSGGGTLNLTNTTATTTNNTFAGGTSVTGGSRLSYSVDAALGAATGNNITLDGGTLASTHTTGTVTLTATRIITIGAGGGTLAMAPTSAGTAGKIVITAAQLTGSGTLFKTGAGDLQITAGTSAFTGPSVLSGLVETVAGGLGTGQVTLDRLAELSVTTGNTLANPIVIGAAGTGANPIISPIGGNTATVGGTIATAGNPFTVALRDFNTTTNTRSLTLAGSLSGGGAMTVTGNAGGQTLFVSANNLVAGSEYTGAISVPAGVNAAFALATSSGSGAITINTSATAVGGIGVGFDALPAFTHTRTGTTTGGVFGINAAAFATALDQGAGSLAGMSIGSQAAGSYTAASLAPDGTNYRLGGGGGTLTVINPVLVGANALVVGDARANGGGTVVLGSLANTFSGAVSVPNGTVSVGALPDGGAASGPLGSGSTAISLGSATTSGTIVYTGGTAASNRPLAIAGAGGGGVTVNTAGANLTLSGGLTTASAGPFTKAGAGTLIVPNNALALAAVNVNAGTLTLNGSGSTFASANVSGGTLNLTSTAGLTLGSLVMASSTNVTGINGTLSVAAGSTLSVGTGTSSMVRLGFVSGSYTTGTNVSLATMNLSPLTNFTANVGEFSVGTATLTGSSSVDVRGTISLAANNNITATSVMLGNSDAQNNNLGTTTFAFGSGTNTVNTPIFTAAGRKSLVTVTVAAGGTVSLANGASAAELYVARNNVSGSTGVANTGLFNMTGGTFVANLSNLIIGEKGAGGGTGSANGTLTLGTSANNAVTATTVVVGNQLTVAATTSNAAGTLNLGGGTFTAGSVTLGKLATSSASLATGTLVTGAGTLAMNGAIADGGGTSTLTLSGTGTVDMKGNNIGSAANPINTLTFTNGTLRNLGALSQPLTQTGANSRLEVTTAHPAAATTIAGNYALASGAASVATGKSLSIAGNIALDATNGGSLGVDLTSGVAGLYAATGTLGLTSTTADKLVITPLTDVTTLSAPITIATFTGGYVTGGDTDFETVVLGDGTATQDTNSALPNYVQVLYNADNIQIRVNNLTAVPEPTSAGLLAAAGVGLLARRRRRVR